MNDVSFYIHLAEHDPAKLAQIIKDLLRAQKPHMLTFAAEAFAHSADSKLAIATVLPLMSHPDAVVREGAVYGLGPHINVKVARRLRDVVQWDPSPAVREVITDALASSTTNVLRTAIIVCAVVCAAVSLVALTILITGSR